MKYKTTVVTMYFNIKHFPDSNDHVRSEDFYLKRGLAVLSVENPLFILCDEASYPKIKEIRDQLVDDSDKKTTYVVKSFTDYDIYKFSYDAISENRTYTKFKTKDRNTASYYVLLMVKFIAILLAKQQNPYNSDFFAWIDFGGNNHSFRKFHTYYRDIIANPHPKISCCYIHYRSKKEIANTKEYVDSEKCGIANNVLTIESNYVYRFYNGIMSIFHEILQLGCGHTDEQCVTILYDRNPELFTIYYGDYNSVVMNYHNIHEDYASIKNFFILETFKNDRSDLTRSAILAVLLSVENGFLQLATSEILWLKNLLQIIWLQRNLRSVKLTNQA